MSRTPIWQIMSASKASALPLGQPGSQSYITLYTPRPYTYNLNAPPPPSPSLLHYLPLPHPPTGHNEPV